MKRLRKIVVYLYRSMRRKLQAYERVPAREFVLPARDFVPVTFDIRRRLIWCRHFYEPINSTF